MKKSHSLFVKNFFTNNLEYLIIIYAQLTILFTECFLLEDPYRFENVSVWYLSLLWQFQQKVLQNCVVKVVIENHVVNLMHFQDEIINLFFIKKKDALEKMLSYKFIKSLMKQILNLLDNKSFTFNE